MSITNEFINSSLQHLLLHLLLKLQLLQNSEIRRQQQRLQPQPNGLQQHFIGGQNASIRESGKAATTKINCFFIFISTFIPTLKILYHALFQQMQQQGQQQHGCSNNT